MKLPRLSKLLPKRNTSGSITPPADMVKSEPVEEETVTARRSEHLRLDKEVEKTLTNEVQNYTYNHQYASGLRHLFKYLDLYPENEDVLELAAILIRSGFSIGNAYEAAKYSEELTDSLLSDQRLDALFNECSKCGSSWISTHDLFTRFSASSTVVNPIGGKCAGCGKVFCRNCLVPVHLGVTSSLFACPECGSNEIKPIERPTGRRPRQVQRVNLPLEFLLFMREGPIPPDPEYLTEVFKQIYPEALQGPETPRIRAVPIEDWKNLSNKAIFTLLAVNEKYLTDDYYVDHVDGVYNGQSFYMTRVYRQAPNIQLAVDPEAISRLSEDPVHFQRLIEEAEGCNDGVKLFEISSLLLQAGNITAGIRYLEKSSRLVPNNSDALPDGVQNSFREFQRSQEIYRNAMALLKTDKRAALELLMQAESITPNWAALHSTLGWFFTLNGRFPEARKSLDKAIEIDPYLPEAHNNLGMLYLFERQRTQAKECFNYALKLRPDYKEAQQNLADLDKNSLNIENEARRTGECGICFWFDWSEISENKHSYYGRYVYQHLLPYLSPRKQRNLDGYFTFRDGDFISQREIKLYCRGLQEETCLKQVVERGTDVCYIVAVHSDSSLDFSLINSSLRNSGVIGYLGMTSCASVEDFNEFVSAVSLVPAFNIYGNRLRKHSFGFLTDDELESLGFEVLDEKQ